MIQKAGKRNPRKVNIWIFKGLTYITATDASKSNARINQAMNDIELNKRFKYL